MSGFSHRLLEHFPMFQKPAIARCTRKTRQLDFRKAKSKLVPPPCRAARASIIRAARLIDGDPWTIAFAPALAIFARHANRGLEGRKSLKD
jgi:hypothetical protein